MIRPICTIGSKLLICATAVLLVSALATSGCKSLFSDVATRIRHALLKESARLRSSADQQLSFSLRPDHWPDGCRGDAGYRLVMTPDRGNKQVSSGDIVVYCLKGGKYYTGMGDETIYVTREIAIEKHKHDDLWITLEKTPRGTEIIRLE